ncbi:MAG: S8 family serine peptidase, partial [Muribaculaceae bacterium]|nr:S8 family serine peptidase [Muribaculaceae bacterium]
LACVVALAAAGYAGAQTTLGIIDRGRLAETRAQIAQNPSRSGEQAEVCVLVRYASADALTSLEAEGARVLHSEKTVALVAMPADRVEPLLQTPGVSSASLSRRFRKLNDKARAASNVDAVYAGEGLDRSYRGNGVIVGIFDMGFDPNHINFIDSDGNSRVKHMNTYMQRYEGVAPTVSRNETPSAIARFTTDSSDDTHATHVIGTAAGSFSEGANADYAGVAPEAEIFMCGGYGSSAEMALAFDDMTKYAASVGKPLVINLSLGDNEGAHDGTDEFSVMLDEIAERTGAHFFLAAGNEGTFGVGLYKEFSGDDTVLRTCLAPDDSYGYYYAPPTSGNIEIWSEDDTPFKLYIDLVDKTAPDAPVTSIEIPQDGGMYLANGTTPSGVSSAMINRNDTQFNTVYSQSYIGAETALSPQNGRFYSVVSFDLTTKSASVARIYNMALRVAGS